MFIFPVILTPNKLIWNNNFVREVTVKMYLQQEGQFRVWILAWTRYFSFPHNCQTGSGVTQKFNERKKRHFSKLKTLALVLTELANLMQVFKMITVSFVAHFSSDQQLTDKRPKKLLLERLQYRSVPCTSSYSVTDVCRRVFKFTHTLFCTSYTLYNMHNRIKTNLVC